MRATGPLLSLKAKNSVGDALTFASWQNINVIRAYAKPGPQKTLAQRQEKETWARVVKYQKNVVSLGNAAAEWRPAALRERSKQTWNSVLFRYLREYVNIWEPMYYPVRVIDLGANWFIEMVNLETGAAEDQFWTFRILYGDVAERWRGSYEETPVSPGS